MTKKIDTTTPVVALFAGLGTLAIMRTLGKMGVDVYVVANNPDSPVLRSRYCKGQFHHSLADDEQDSLIELLQSISKDIGRKPILIATSDELAIMVAECHMQLSDYYLIAQNTGELTRTLADKMQMFRLARAHDLPSPKTVLPATCDEASEMAEELQFPVMLKAVFGNRMQARSGRKMARADTRSEMLSTFRELEDPEFPNIMLQELIPGDDDQVWIFNGFFDENSDCQFPFTGKKIRQFPIHVGAASLGECVWNEQVAKQTTEFMKAIGYRGILDIGYRYDERDGLYKVLDINPRVGQAFRIFVGEGDVDVVKCLYLSVTNQPLPEGGSPLEGRRWMIEDYDLVSSVHYMQEGSLSLMQWFRSLWTVDEVAWFDWRDKRPALSIYWELFKRGIARAAKYTQRQARKLGDVFFRLQRKVRQIKLRLLPRHTDQVYFGDRVDEYESVWRSIATDIGASFEKLDSDIWQISNGVSAIRLCQYQLPLDNPVVLEMASRKAAVHNIMRAHDIPTPEFVVVPFSDFGPALEFLEKYPAGVVVKPNAGYGGKGVTTHVTNPGELKDAILTASLYDRNILVENQVYGECYRVLVYKGQVMSAVRRTGLRLIGDGVRSVAELLGDKGRGDRDADLNYCLTQLGLEATSVLPKEGTALVKCIGPTFRSGNELRTIYDTDVTAELCEAVREQACLAAKLVGSEFAGVDIITADITQSLSDTGGVVNEVNTTPALHHHYDASNDTYPAVARDIVVSLLEKNA